jgi:ribosomal protein S12 methylthiotransferase accessory factor
MLQLSRHRRALHRLSAVAEYLVDAQVGIVECVEEERREAGAPDFFHFSATACNTKAFTRLKNFRNAGGAATDRGAALAKAIGEAVERYCSAIFELEELSMFSYKSAPFTCVPPHEFVLYSREQYEQPGFPWVPYDNETTVRWTPAKDLGTGEICYVPAARVFMPYVYQLPLGDAAIDQPISTGLACHVSWTEAALSGIYEVIERDAFMLVWQSMIAPPQIRIETLSDENRDLVDRFERVGSSVVIFDITMDHGVPTILSVLRGYSPSEPALVFAASASLDPEEAARKSLEELAHTRRYSWIIKKHVPRLRPSPLHHDNVNTQMDHLNFYVDENNTPYADWIFSSTKRIEFSELVNLATDDPAMDLQILVNKVSAVNERILVANLTTADIAELGLSVIRAIIPGFQPLHMGYALRALGGKRLWEVPQRLGYRGVGPESGDNPAPHPYP